MTSRALVMLIVALRVSVPMDPGRPPPDVPRSPVVSYTIPAGLALTIGFVEMVVMIGAIGLAVFPPAQRERNRPDR